MNVRSLLIFSAMLLLVFANAAYAGKYLRAKDRKTLVWDNNPKHGEAVSWSGERDEKGYGTGKGTITWYKVERKALTGFHLPSATYTPIIAYSGKMVRGKLNGRVVTVDPKNGKTFRAKFADGRRVGRWAEGPAPDTSSPAVRPDAPGIAEQKPEEPVVRRAELVEPAPPAAGPSTVADQPAKQDVAKPAATDTQKVKQVPSEYDDSLRALLGPPSSLQTRVAAEPSPKASIAPAVSAPPARPRLTQAEVIDLADAEARTQGRELGEYQRPQARYTAAGDTWSVVYDQKKDANGMGETGKHFSISVEDKTKKTSIAAER